MANILVNTGFFVGSDNPVDGKSRVQTLADRDQLATNGLAYESLRCYVLDEKKWYEFDGTNWKDADSVTTTDLIEKDNENAVSSKGVYGALYTTIPETQDAYIKVADGSVPGALEVVDDSTASPTSTQIKVSDVTPVRDVLYTPSIGDYVVLELGVAAHDVTTYMPREETYTKDVIDSKIIQASSGLEMYTESEYTSFMDNLVVTSKNLNP